MTAIIRLIPFPYYLCTGYIIQCLRRFYTNVGMDCPFSVTVSVKEEMTAPWEYTLMSQEGCLFKKCCKAYKKKGKRCKKCPKK